ncbi:MAG: flagellar hook-basal body complex protein [Alphaproteobacteria bacterium]|nr:flagellar hook-basal body complex protein [Alphaproteobacteria bacterium]
MSLYGALFTGVSGLKAQGTKIGIISDNIANVNTVGYKATKAAFETLVVNNGSTRTYSPGGVIANSVQLVDKQGILTATDVSTDIAISGSGFFTVKANEDGSGEPLYTRAGSFRQDSLGNFRNTAGFYLMGWPLDNEGRLPGAAGNLNTTSSANLDSLEVVNIETQSGVASATTTVEVGANLNASELVHPGSGVDAILNVTSSPNNGVSGSAILVPDTGTGSTAASNFVLGDNISVMTGAGQSYVYEYGGFEISDEISALNPMFNAQTTVQTFFTDLSPYTEAARSFTITTGGVTKTFTYVNSSPNADSGQFNSMSTLAAAIDAQAGLSARVVGGELFIAPEDANNAMIFANVDAVGTAGPPALAGLDWLAELGLANTTASVSLNRFASLNGLAALVNSSDGVSATVSNALADASLRIFVDDPLDTIAYYDGNVSTATANTGSILTEFGLTAHANYSAGTGPGGMNVITALSPAYDSSGLNGENMASGDITADFSRNVRVYDALGAGHDVRMSFLKIGVNQWAVEIHALPATDVNSVLPNGQVATGTITFNGDGSLRSVSTGLTLPVNIAWTNGALASQVTFDVGTAGQPTGTIGATQFGLTDGLSQFESDYNVAFVNQNGAPVGELIGVAIDELGFVIASYSNGETQRLFKLPVADFTNPNGLKAVTGNVYSQTQESGEVNLREAGTNGTGKVVSGAVESSNVELSEELTDMIVAQRAYQASSKVISTTDELLEELTRL